MRGKVRISATSDFGRYLLCGWLDEFNERYPDVSFALTLSDSVSNLLLEEIDLAIRFGAPPDSGLAARQAGAEPARAVRFAGLSGAQRRRRRLPPISTATISSCS